MYVLLHNESQSESLYKAACLLHKQCGSSRKSGDCANRYVCGLFWPLLIMCLYHGAQPIGLFVSWFSCCEILALLYYCCSFTIPLVRMTTVRLKLLYITTFSQISQIDHVREDLAIYKYLYVNIIALYIYIYSMNVDCVELVPVVMVGERVSVGLLFLW